MSIHAISNNSCIVIQSWEWGHAGFLGKWLLAAAHAETLWREARKNPAFENQVERVCGVFIPDFGIAASEMLGRLLKAPRTVVVLDLGSEEAEDFAMMAAMGFFAPYRERYRLSIPSDLSLAKVKKAILRFAETEDEEYALHPEGLVNTMLFSEARALQKSVEGH